MKEVKPAIKVAGVSRYNLRKSELKEGDVVIALADPYIDEFNPKKSDKGAVKLMHGNLCIGYIPRDSGWRKYFKDLIFTVKSIRCNKMTDKGEIFIKTIKLELSGADAIEESIQDTEITFPYRVYWLKGVPYPSITTILGVKVIDDTAKKWMIGHDSYEYYESVMNFYSRRGTVVHDALEKYCNDGIVVEPEYFTIKNQEHKLELLEYNNMREMSISQFGYTRMPVKHYINLNNEKPDDEKPSDSMYKYYMGGINFLQKEGVEVIAAEEMMVSEKYGVAGSCDLFARVKGKLMALDWKTSNNAKTPTYGIQASFYASCYQEDHNEKVYSGIVKLSTETKKGYDFIIVDNQEVQESMIPLYKSVFAHQHSKLDRKKNKDFFNL